MTNTNCRLILKLYFLWVYYATRHLSTILFYLIAFKRRISGIRMPPSIELKKNRFIGMEIHCILISNLMNTIKSIGCFFDVFVDTLKLYNIMSCQCSNSYIYDRSIIYETVEQLSVYIYFKILCNSRRLVG